MNKLYKGLKLYMEYKYANHAQFISTILLFSGAIPILVGLIPIYFFLYYWMEKVLSKQ